MEEIGKEIIPCIHHLSWLRICSTLLLVVSCMIMLNFLFKSENGNAVKTVKLKWLIAKFICYFMLQVMKENCTIAKPHLVENFIQDLMSEHTEKDENVSFTRVRRVFCVYRHL